MGIRIGLAACALALLAGSPALAAPEEIQVYIDDIGPPHEPGLDVHLNYVPDGRTQPDYPGEQASQDRWRVTPEWSYALNPNFELGAYLPLTTLDSHGDFRADGIKGRIKWIAPHAEGQAWFWGLNFEIGREAKLLAPNPWNAELKGILGVRTGPWMLAANLNADFAVSGPALGPVDWQLAGKAAYKIAEKTSIGVETYNDLGGGHDFGQFAKNDQSTYLAVDTSLGKWDLNLGVGYGYGHPEDRWILKAIIGVPIG